MKMKSLIIILFFCKYCEAQFFDKTLNKNVSSLTSFLEIHKSMQLLSAFVEDFIDITIPEDAKLNFSDLTKKYGHPCEEYNIVSKDGYITKLFHLPGDKKRPVVLWHGLFDSSDIFVIRGNTSMAITLAYAGYDVWLGNLRGNKHSRKHKTLNPDRDHEYWDFDFDEMALNDLPPTIDFILEHTGQKQVYAIGHSQGASIFCAMTSTFPEYNKKIKILIALAPAVFLDNIKPPIRTLIDLAPLLYFIPKNFRNFEIIANSSISTQFLQKVCPIGLPGYILCAETILFYICGHHEVELEPDFLPILINHFPSGTTLKNVFHLAQSSISGRYARFDAGVVENLRLYGSEVPPKYDLSAVTMKVAIFTGKNDKLVVVKDTERLRDELNNVVMYKVMEDDKISHFDFVCGRHAYKYLFPNVIELLMEN